MAKEKKDWHELISQPIYQMRAEKNVLIPMRDGVLLASDIYLPDAEDRFPALISFIPFGKRHEEMAFSFPPQARPSYLWDGTLESGDTPYLVTRGYIHAIVDARGTGESEEEFYVKMIGGGARDDLYDVIEWVAQQPWCDGNVGMVGISWLASAQVFAAEAQPPHLRAIFPEGGHYHIYGMMYQGGIQWLMPRAAMEGRGGDGFIPTRNPRSITMEKLSKEELERRIEERLQDPDIKNYPNHAQILKYPWASPLWFDVIMNPYDNEFYENDASRQLDRIEVPMHVGCQFGRGWVVDTTIDAYLKAKGPKKLVLRSPPPIQERPFYQFHDEIVRWYDYWLKGIDTGIMDEPPMKIFVGGIDEWHYEHEWPLARTKWTKFYLRSRNRLLREPEPFSSDVVPPDGFYQAPLTVTSKVSGISYMAPAFVEDTEMTGPCALYLYATIDTDDTNWIVRISDVDPKGDKVQLTTGWLKASHREIDECESKPWEPHHPHTRSVPVVPGEIVEYPIRIYPMSHVFKKGHIIELEINSLEDPYDPRLGVLPPDSFHLNSGRATTHKIHRDKDYASYLVLPIIPAG